MEDKIIIDIENILDFDSDTLSPKSLKKMDFSKLKEILFIILTPEDKQELIELCRMGWYSILRNLNPKRAEKNPMIFVWVTHILKVSIKRIQEKAKKMETGQVEKEVQEILG